VRSLAESPHSLPAERNTNIIEYFSLIENLLDVVYELKCRFLVRIASLPIRINKNL
jgi:hypothetical protein